ncbi:hypothetical protein MPNTM1_04609 [Mycolicibacterium parafortuitum]|uniref:hypothetical protein n=1 Tax=Mycolicibacterium parafortuitum TaxID=39692 RepID=UPI0032C40A8A
MITETFTVHRGDTDRFGNASKEPAGTVDGALGWGTATRNTGERAESAATRAELFVAKGSDLKPRDRVTRASGQSFAVIGGPYYDQLHPMTGFNFGWTVYQLDAVTG